MQNYPRNIHTKFGSNWSSSVEEKSFEKLLTTDNDGRQVMAIAHMAIDQVN